MYQKVVVLDGEINVGESHLMKNQLTMSQLII